MRFAIRGAKRQDRALLGKKLVSCVHGYGRELCIALRIAVAGKEKGLAALNWLTLEVFGAAGRN